MGSEMCIRDRSRLYIGCNRLYFGHVSAISRPDLGQISARSRLCLGCISPISRVPSSQGKYRVGLGAHHEEYIFSPESEAEVRALENAIDDAAAEVASWQDEVVQAGVAAMAAGKSPINAALAKAVELSTR